MQAFSCLDSFTRLLRPILVLPGHALLRAMPICWAWLGLAFTPLPGNAATPLMKNSWAGIDQLVNEQKFEQAAGDVARLREQARSAGDAENWTLALVREAQLRTGLHGYETAVRAFREQPWPQDDRSQLVLRLFYAHSLTHYARAYGHEIRSRTRVEAHGPVDLKAWTIDQIYAEANAQYFAAWQQRAALASQASSRLAPYLEGGNYPAGLRDSLRDLVTYLWVAHLADTAGWTPAQLNERYALPLPALLAGIDAPGRSAVLASVKLDDPSTHPALRLSALLHELHDWRSRDTSRDAAWARASALEARLELARQLFALLDDEAQRRTIVSDLEQRLPAYRDAALGWYAEGKATQAQFLLSLGSPVQAHAQARAGRTAFADSPGGRRCAALIAQIEAPGLAMQAMSADGPGQRSVQIKHKNLARLYFRAYTVDFERRLRSDASGPLPDWRFGRDLVEGRPRAEPIAQWSVALPATPDYAMHTTYVTPPLTAPGLVMLLVSVREDFSATEGNRLVASPFLVTNTVLVTRSLAGRFEVQAFDARSGMPLQGVDVALHEYSPQRTRRVSARAQTDANGVAQLPQPPERRGYFVVARRDGQIALDPNFFNTYDDGGERDGQSALIYTDRSVYRPQQTLHFKVLAYQVRSGPSRARAALQSARADAAIEVILRDANGQEVAKRSLRTNAFGTAAGEFLLPAGRLLGQWSVSTAGGSSAVRVEEYKRPTFEVSLNEAAQAYRLNTPARVRGNARYYFGLPVTSGELRWTVRREAVYAYWFYGRGGLDGAPAREQIVATGGATLDPDGNFEFAFTPSAAETAPQPGLSYRYRVAAELTDEGGETRSATRSFRLGWVAIESQLAGDTQFARANQAHTLRARRSDLDGTPQAGPAKWSLFALQAPARASMPADDVPDALAQGIAMSARGSAMSNGSSASSIGVSATPGDLQNPRWQGLPDVVQTLRRWPLGQRMAAGELQHDAQGQATIAMPALPVGAYRVVHQTGDRFGALASSEFDFIVGADGGSLPVAALLLADKSSVQVGESLRLLVASALPDQTLFIEFWRGEQRLARHLLTLARSGKDAAPGAVLDKHDVVTGQPAPMHVIDWPVGEALRGGFHVTLTGVRDHQVLLASQDVFVPWDNKQLKLGFSTFRDKLTPGAKETWRVSVQSADGKAEVAGAEVLATMYDRSLDLFAPHAVPALPWPAFTGAFTAQSASVRAQPAFALHDAWPRVPLEPPLRGEQLSFQNGYAIGGPGARFRMMARNVAESDMPRALGKASMVAQESRRELTDSRDAMSAAQAPAAPAPAEAKSKEDAGAAPAGAPLRSNFSETAFFQPQLLTDSNGTALIEFTVPDSVTAWSVWAHALTRDLRSGSAQREARSIKELLVRPYLPRFLRAGDDALLRVAINNAGTAALSGEVNIALTDPATGADVSALFLKAEAGSRQRSFAKLAPGGTQTVSYRLVAPYSVGQYAVRVVASSGALSDGELRPLPVLPSRIHLAQSRFVTLRNADTKLLRFADLENTDPTRINERLVVNVDAQLFTSVLSALPYLQNYPYECTEQTLNRFVSSGIVASVMRDFPAVAKMGEQLAQRSTRLEALPVDDANRKLAFEESPWLNQASGKDNAAHNDADLIRVLDPKVANAERETSLAKLRKAQLPSGAFPWFAGGPESPYITLYLMAGFARAAEFGVPVPKEVVQRGWAYLATHFRSEYASRLMARDCCSEWLTYLNYAAGSYPDASWVNAAISPQERSQILDFSFKHWKRHSPYLKGLLSLTLKRAGRDADAMLVWDSVMDSARSNDEQGTFWAAEDRSWLWYNDTIESHAFALRVMTELAPRHPKRDGLIQWLLLNKKLSHWKSTRATAEVIYALAHAMKQDKTLGVREAVSVTVAQRKTDFVFEPERYTGRNNQLVIQGAEVGPATAQIRVEKSTPGFAFASATWHFSTEQLPAEERGDFFQVSRQYFRRDASGAEVKLVPLTEGAGVKVGDQLEVRLSLRTKHAAEYMHLRDPRGAGFEPESLQSRWRYELGLAYYEEVRDSGANFFFEQLPVGEYTFRYRVRAAMAGNFRVAPATVQSLYAPEFAAYSAGARLGVSAAR